MAAIVIEHAKDGTVGVSKKIKEEGDGKKPPMGCFLKVNFSIFLDDGRVLNEGKNKEIQLGKREVWGTGADLALASMKVGERAHVRCEKEFAGPDDGHAPTTLDLRLLSIDGDGVGWSPSEIRFLFTMLLLGVTIVVGFLWKEGFFK